MSRGKWTIWAVCLWGVSGVLLAFFDRPIVDALWIVAGFVYLLFIFVGVLLLISIIVYAVLKKSVLAAKMSVCLIALASGLYFLEPILSRSGNNAIVHSRFETGRPIYDQIIDNVQQNPSRETSGEFQQVRYLVDKGPPLRVAFPQPGGFLDNWEGVVYDPSGEVEEAQGWTQIDGKQAFTAPDSVVRLFGGDIVSCSRIERHYYRCWFT